MNALLTQIVMELKSGNIRRCEAMGLTLEEIQELNSLEQELAVWQQWKASNVDNLESLDALEAMMLIAEQQDISLTAVWTFKGKSKITRQMLRRIWTNSGNVSDSVLDVVAEEFSNKFEKCRINTKNRLYHFFAQIYQEVGSAFNLNEGFNYRPQVLIDKFSYYRNHSQYAQIDGYIPGRQAQINKILQIGHMVGERETMI